MTRLILLISLTVVLSACGANLDPESAQTCRDVEDMTMTGAQMLIDLVEEVPYEELRDAGEAAIADNKEIQDLAETIRALEDRHWEMDCPISLSEVMYERSSDLTFTNRSGEYVVQMIAG
jgi:hypothetical protein